ncbi:hypothetical protein E4M02_04270 [Brevundimonas sp. S30B]|nr:hypothetical protein E4M01_03545 [Brevundimonas sp. MF30-B]TFW04293.1 hypothetical protein E4M02_04270 [Brevundimonas sp. S30B]
MPPTPPAPMSSALRKLSNWSLRPNPTPTRKGRPHRGRPFFSPRSERRPRMYAAPLTELEAVNDMLAVIGQAPVNAFTANNSDQNIARQELAKVVREVCAYGFKFNTDEGHTLYPEIDGTVSIPSGALSVDPMDPRQDLTPRQHPDNGMCLWDAAHLSWTIEAPVVCRVRWSLTYDALPELARGYAVIRAGRKLQARLVGSPELDRFAAEDEQRAWLALQREQAATADINVFRASNEIAAKIVRGRVADRRFTK